MEKSSSSLSEVNSSVNVPQNGSWLKRLMAFIGPAYLISVGYMDPGNWATDIAAGSRYGYNLLWVLLMSNLIALLLQSHCTRLGIVRKLDLAQASRLMYPKWINYSLYTLAEIAIAATDLAEVIGFAIGLELLFNIPILWGVIISLLDTFIILGLLNYGIRKIEIFIISLISIIGGSFLIQLFFANPSVSQVAKGFIPTLPDDAALYFAIGIIGATVMPHNLYLHSALVQTRNITSDYRSVFKAIRFNFIDSAIALNAAFFVNAAILILAGAAFYNNNLYNISEIQDAHKLLMPLLGTHWAPILFAVALIAAGQSSAITGTLAGQVVMEGYINLRIQPWLRRLITRMIAVIPALIVVYLFGEKQTGKMLILSQVVLSLQLGFAIIPLIHLVSDREKMKEFTISLTIKILSWTSAIIIVGLNLKLVTDWFLELIQNSGWNFWLIAVLLILIYILAILIFISFYSPSSNRHFHFHTSPSALTFNLKKEYSKIAIAVDFSSSDNTAIQHALAQGN
ncbi:MAG: Nramp family divalent metal transporter, partial [Bacteroidia bacterium]|nr:Nramp family divalent metal transporter [Bacteroidia bacterium]